MKAFSEFSIRYKLYVLVVSATSVALLLASTAFVLHDISTFRKASVSHMTSVAEVLGANTVAALTFDDIPAATEILASLARETTVVRGCLYDSQGKIFANFVRQQSEDNPQSFPASRSGGHTFRSNGMLDMFTLIYDEEGIVGSLYLQASMGELHARIARYGGMVVLVMILALAAALGVASGLAHRIADPIVQLASTAARVSKERDFSVRVVRPSEDELGLLYDAFNDMLSQIELGQLELIEARDHLELRVEQRTKQLSNANHQLQQEMDEKERVRTKLMDLSREAGKAEVATGVLHNVGNVLNSVNVSAGLVSENLRASKVSNLQMVCQTLRDHSEDFGEFVSKDDRGKMLPQLLERLATHLVEEQKLALEELSSLQGNVDHIKDIVSMQQAYGKLTGVAEKLEVAKIIEDAISITCSNLSGHRIHLVREFEESLHVNVDRHKMLQILVNLFSNAKRALDDASHEEKKLTVRVKRDANECVLIQVLDNGIGISKDNLLKIFSHGFTTKNDGHGFGLHSSALAAKDLEGSLSVHSGGLNQGATFTLRIPTSQKTMLTE